MSTPFHNRERELSFLQAALGSPRSELLLLYGRRGVGKSALLERALAAHRGPLLYYRATRRTLPLQLAGLTEAAREAFPQAFLEQGLSSTDLLMSFLSHQAEREGGPMVLVIDELPYLAEVDPGLLTSMQHWWDANKRRPNIKVVLSGSYVGFMERQVLDVQAPLYHRRTGAMRLKPLDYQEASRFFPGWSPQDRLTAYAVLGGMPIYLEQFDPARDLEHNICDTILKGHTFLAEEPDWLLLEDLRRDIIHGSILRAIATGSRKPSDIARAVGKASAQDIFPRLTTLIELGLVCREVPITYRNQPHTRNSLYWIADPYLDFWYRFVDPARALVDRGMGDQIWQRRIQPEMDVYVSRPAFERACRQFVWRSLAAGGLNCEVADVGSWWSAHSELDVVAVDARERVTLVGSCKWTTQPVDVKQYAELLAAVEGAGWSPAGGQKGGLRRSRDEVLYLMFSRAGFAPRLRELAAASERLQLVDLEDMYRV